MLALLVLVLGATSCFCEERSATCVLDSSYGLPDSNVKGVVSFYQKCADENIQISVRVTGLPPLAADGSNRQHGFHIHAFGDLTGGCASTGGHYNPTGVNHGAPEDDVRHVGDFGNLEQAEDGSIDVTFTDPIASLFGDFSVIGRAVVLHQDADDLGKGGNAASLANGNAGARVACCVIGVAKEA
ncbi:hypothetical protein EGW08_001385 [Elysia chlorotica]|uniref:Superoxide dismutase [Cu-Zn] n=1 Tax=Elysia chlorotica TaxID=188477 RepID=A0A433UAQ4_ELYCH|nr:hypothetical protein EGW08_001385 [Elysia chlorotica]